VHAFVDESRRYDTYYLAAAIVEPRHLPLLLPGQRELHFKKETPARRREILSALCGFGVEVRIYSADCRRGEERARQECLVRLIRDLLDVGAPRLVLDGREGRDVHEGRASAGCWRKATTGRSPTTTWRAPVIRCCGSPTSPRGATGREGIGLGGLGR
jgi:hypothetical protein